MAIVVESVSADYASDTSDTQLDVSVPTGTQDGDVLIAMGFRTNGGTLTAPGGWSSLYAGSYTKAWYKVASSESGSYAFATAAWAMAHVVIVRLSGADSTTIDVASAEELNASWDSSINCPDVSVTYDDSLVLRFGQVYANQPRTVTSTEGTEEYDVTNLTAAFSLAVYSHTQASGTYTATALTLSSDSGDKCGMTLAVSPSGGTPSTYTTVREETFYNETPFDQDEVVGTARAYNGSPPYTWEIIRQTLLP